MVTGLLEIDDLQKIREDDCVLERRRNPDQVQRILVDVDPLRQRCRIVRAQEGAVSVGAETEVSNAHFQLCLADNVGDGSCHTGIDLRGIVGGSVFIIVEVDEEDAGNKRRRRGATC